MAVETGPKELLMPQAITLFPKASPRIGGFWEPRTVSEHAAAQGVGPIDSLDAVCGGWPEDEIGDGFEITVRHWRSAELGNSETAA